MSLYKLEHENSDTDFHDDNELNKSLEDFQENSQMKCKLIAILDYQKYIIFKKG